MNRNDDNNNNYNYNTNVVGCNDSITAEEQALLDEIERSTDQLNKQTRNIYNRVNSQSHLLHDIEQKHDDSHQSLEQNIIKLYEAKMLNSGYGWMYTIIVIEVVLLILLLYIGL